MKSESSLGFSFVSQGLDRSKNKGCSMHICTKSCLVLKEIIIPSLPQQELHMVWHMYT